ncbi:geranylgeranyl transferase type-1 subunit beta [Thecaphora frezii]
MEAPPDPLQRRKHVAFYLRHLSMLPQPYTSADGQRMTLAYFALSSLDLLGAVEEKLKPEERSEYVDWIYEQQCPAELGGGFRGGPSIGSAVASLATLRVSQLPTETHREETSGSSQLGGGNLAMTYTALLSLAILRDNFQRLDRAALLHHLRSCQQPDGSFAPSIGHREYDCRFVFCAFAVCWMLDDWSAIDVERAIDFLRRSRCWDGSFGQVETQEGHGGSTYCAVAALALAQRLDVLDEDAMGTSDRDRNATPRVGGSDRRRELERWLLNRQQRGSGFNGRLEKPVDTCYSFWCGAALEILGQHGHIDAASDIEWILSAVSPVGGISKVPEDPPDLMHSYLSTAALSLHAYGTEAPAAKGPMQVADETDGELDAIRTALRSSLRPLDAALNLSKSTKEWLVQHLHRRG